MEEARTLCRSPMPGAKVTPIPTWKFARVREAILAALPEALPGLPARRRYEPVERRLARDDLERPASLRWQVTTAKLAREVTGEIVQVLGVRPRHLFRRGRGSRA
jgi:hypothetical protein